MAEYWVPPEDDTDDKVSEDNCMDMDDMEAAIMESAFAQQISLQEYEKQKTEYTKAAVQALLQCNEYQRKLQTCFTCWICWKENQYSTDCMECGGFPMKRPCPICNGKCQTIWSRDVELSHSMHEAHWSGECGLPFEEQQGYLFNVLTESNVDEEELMMDALGDLNTS